jgi:hypothetical protein
VVVLLGAGCASRTADTIPPPSAAIVLDGRVTPEEWGISESIPPQGDVHLRMDARYLYVAVRGNSARPVHLYLASAEEVHVLHASGSLGRAVYRSEPGGAWELVAPFEWRVRDPAFARAPDAPDVELERAQHLQDQGWAANTVATGRPGQVEFQVERSYLERQGAGLAVSYLWREPDGSERIRHWPDSAEVTPEEFRLLMGESVPAQFTPRGWSRRPHPRD